MPRFFKLPFQRRDRLAEVAQDRLVAAVAHVGRHEVLQRLFVDVADLLDRTGVLVVLDVHPADAAFHRRVLLEHFVRRVALDDDVGRVEDQHQRRMIHLAVDLGQQCAALADQIGFDLQPEGQVAAVAGLGDLAELVDHLRQVLARVGASG